MRRFWESEFDGSDENLAYWTKKISNIATFDLSSVGFFPFFLLKILLSTFLNFILVLILQFLLLSSDTKYDWN